jgi:hypothetical protein
MDFDPSASSYNPANAGGYNDVFVAKYAPDGRFLWARGLYQRQYDEIAGDVAVSPNGDVTVVGAFNGTLDFDPGSGTVTRSAYTGSNAPDAARAAFVWRLDKNGNFKWVRTPGNYSGRVMLAKAVASGPFNDVYVSGTFSGTIRPTDGLTSGYVDSKGGRDIWVARFAAGDGATDWAGTMGGASDDDVNDAAVGADGNLHLVGSYNSATFDADPTLYGVANLSRAGGTSAFVAEIYSAGGFVQAKKFGGTGSNVAVATGVAVDGSGSIHVVGRFNGSIDLDPSGTSALNFTSGGGNDLFIVKLNTAGDLTWARTRGGSGDDAATGVALGLGGAVFVSGSFSGSFDFDPGAGTTTLTSAGGRDAFLWKLNSAGAFQSALRIGGTGADHAVAVAVDALGRISLTGIFDSTVDLDPGPFTFNAFAGSGADIFVIKLLR